MVVVGEGIIWESEGHTLKTYDLLALDRYCLF